jgi:hypothetical protein
MKDQSHAEGIMAMLVERFEGQHLDRLLELKSAVEGGELLGEYDSSYLASVIVEAMQSKVLVDQHPEYHDLYTRAVRLYREIAEQALENELKAAPNGASPIGAT